MEKVRRIVFLFISLLVLLPLVSCQDKMVINNAFVYLVHENCYVCGKIGLYNNGDPIIISENTYQWQIVFVGDYSEEIVAVPNKGYKFVSWSDGLTTPNRKDLANNKNDSGPVLYYAYFEVDNGHS